MNLEDIDKEIGARIRSIRQLRKISQERLGKEAGITFQQIQKYEKGTNRVSGSRLVQISKILEVDVAIFFEGFRPEDGVQSVTVAAILTENKLLKERLAEIRKLSNL